MGLGLRLNKCWFGSFSVKVLISEMVSARAKRTKFGITQGKKKYLTEKFPLLVIWPWKSVDSDVFAGKSETEPIWGLSLVSEDTCLLLLFFRAITGGVVY